MKFCFITWNARGAVISDLEKHQNLLDMIQKSKACGLGLPLFFIQEAGVCDQERIAFGRDKYCCFKELPYENDRQCKNDRCTLAILYPEQHRAFVKPFYFETQQTNRPIGAILINGRFLIATIHATAREGIAVNDVCSALDNLHKRDYPCMLLGDMNSEPDLYSDKECLRYFSIFCPEQPTHEKGKYLDYMFVEKGYNVEVNCYGVENRASSDHCLVVYSVNVPFV